MSNHVHVLAVPHQVSSLARAFGGTHNDYARWQNARRQGSGHLWQNRYFSCPLDGDHQWEALRNVELNPVRAGIVQTASEWAWSSARARLGGRDISGLPDTTDWAGRWSAEGWREVLADRLTDAAMLERIREATRIGPPRGRPGISGRGRGPLRPAAASGEARAEVIGRDLRGTVGVGDCIGTHSIDARPPQPQPMTASHHWLSRLRREEGVKEIQAADKHEYKTRE